MADSRVAADADVFRAAFDATPVGVALIDTDGRFVLVNQALCRVLRTGRDDLVGMTLDDFLRPDERSAPFDLLAQLSANEGAVRLARPALRSDGAAVDLRISASIVRLASGHVHGVLAFIEDATEDVATARMLEESEARFRGLVQHGFDAVLVCSSDLTVVYASPPSTTVLGRHPSDLIGRKAFELATEEYKRRALAELASLLARPGPKGPVVYEMVDPAGGVRHIEAVAVNLLDDPAVRGIVVNCRNVTERVRAEADLRESEERYRFLVDHLNEVVFRADLEGRYVFLNPAWERITGFSIEESLGRPYLDFVLAEEREVSAGRFRSVVEEGHETVRRDVPYRTKSGGICWLEVWASPVYDADGTLVGVAGTLTDATERHTFVEHLTHQAMHDPLTSLPNRNLLEDRLAQALHRAQRAGTQVAVLFIDVDHFKLVNDSLGHSVGDELLMTVAHRLRHEAREAETVARFGGDEFVVVVEEVRDPLGAAAVAHRLHEALRRPIPLGDRDHVIGVSIGVAVAPPLDSDAVSSTVVRDLLRDADLAMYRAKERGRGRVEMFEESLRRRAQRRLAMEVELRSGIAVGEVVPWYQPVVELSSGRVVGCEALARWVRPGRGVVTPAEFIPVAEECGLISDLGRVVLDSALADLRQWRPTGSETVSVNLSARQLDGGRIVEDVANLLDRQAMAPHRLVLELTESAVMADPVGHTRVLEELAELGVVLAIDDFGAGHSSLAYLRDLPVRVLKLDRSFVASLAHRHRDQALVGGVVQLAHDLGLVVVAEGVEDPDQSELLRHLGCDLAQGWLFGAPGRFPPG